MAAAAALPPTFLLLPSLSHKPVQVGLLTMKTAAKPLAKQFESFVMGHPLMRRKVIDIAQVRCGCIARGCCADILGHMPHGRARWLSSGRESCCSDGCSLLEAHQTGLRSATCLCCKLWPRF